MGRTHPASIKTLDNRAPRRSPHERLFQSGSDASPLFSTVASGHRNIFLRVLRRLKSGVFCFFSPRTHNLGEKSLGPCQEQPQTSRKKAGEHRRQEGLRGCFHHASSGPTCEGAGPCGARPISTYVRSPGSLPLAPASRGAQRGAESFTKPQSAIPAAFPPFPLQLWGFLAGL